MKKGMFDLFNNWVEVLALLFLGVGFIIALKGGSALASYVMITIIGCIVGRIWNQFKKGFRFRWVVIIAGFLIGFLLGDLYGNDVLVVLLFLAGAVGSYYLHSKKYIRV